MRRRKPWVAFWFSFLCPGLGQLYNGSPLWALSALVVGTVVALITALYFFSTLKLLLAAMLLGLAVDLAYALHAYLQAKRLGTIQLRPYQRWWIYLGFVLLAYGLPDGYGTLMPERFRSFQIPSESMVPNLLVGDRLVADGWAYWHKDPQRGDVAVFDYPKDPSTKFVKRVIGVPGDTVEIKGGELYVNNEPVQEERSSRPIVEDKGWGRVEYLEDYGDKHMIYRSQPTLTMRFGPVKVPPESYFMMGDNRDRSNDSRFWGFVRRDEIIAQLSYVFFSWDSTSHSIRWDRIGLHVK
jgi:signal peptidase I